CDMDAVAHARLRRPRRRQSAVVAYEVELEDARLGVVTTRCVVAGLQEGLSRPVEGVRQLYGRLGVGAVRVGYQDLDVIVGVLAEERAGLDVAVAKRPELIAGQDDSAHQGCDVVRLLDLEFAYDNGVGLVVLAWHADQLPR